MRHDLISQRMATYAKASTEKREIINTERGKIMSNINTFIQSSHIHKDRYPQPAPEKAVFDGRSVFGAFDGVIKNVNIDETHRPLSIALPRFINRLRMKEWEAYQVSFDEGFICGAIYNMGAAVFNIMMFYEKTEKTVKANHIFGYPRNCVGNTLFGGTNSLETDAFKAEIRNNLEKGIVLISVDYSPSSKKRIPMVADLLLTMLSKPGVTIMPLGENRPLYTYKNLFKVEGSIKIGGRVFKMNERSLGIIDDHKGYYPRRTHYDWITCMGQIDGVHFGVNLCKNQALEPEKYCENILWLGKEAHLLPTVSFERLNGNWHICDKHKTVDITFFVDDSYVFRKMFFGSGANYIAPFGKVMGYVTDSDGNKIILDGMTSMGEDTNYVNI